ncbi:hypothetical protein RF55_10964 [Lasius niger]|uniref:Uncharacterized protein n=1 Tax=Lasius niger TaxID=67767 RepID=A0A0J7KGT1_LASNI|nr:hypothetical protein RF55_10964 [Lasius niger]
MSEKLSWTEIETEIEQLVNKKRTGWIINQTKQELLTTCEKLNVPVPKNANLESVRNLLRDFIKSTDTKESESDDCSNTEEREEEEMARAIGKLLEFVPEIQSWEDYIEQFEFYLEANNINEESKKRSTLLTAVGVKIYSTIKSFCLRKHQKRCLIMTL